mmetsp:Transcript_9907/g.26916  ORF Transcript_9907/g.26916 Transcript_9907/m.26916 type:complete len:355 (-) Transcript_9907:91-1155(-)
MAAAPAWATLPSLRGLRQTRPRSRDRGERLRTRAEHLAPGGERVGWSQGLLSLRRAEHRVAQHYVVVRVQGAPAQGLAHHMCGLERLVGEDVRVGVRARAEAWARPSLACGVDAEGVAAECARGRAWPRHEGARRGRPRDGRGAVRGSARLGRRYRGGGLGDGVGQAFHPQPQLFAHRRRSIRRRRTGVGSSGGLQEIPPRCVVRLGLGGGEERRRRAPHIGIACLRGAALGLRRRGAWRWGWPCKWISRRCGRTRGDVVALGDLVEVLERGGIALARPALVAGAASQDAAPGEHVQRECAERGEDDEGRHLLPELRSAHPLGRGSGQVGEGAVRGGGSRGCGGIGSGRGRGRG